MNGAVVFAAVMLLGVVVAGCATQRAPQALPVPQPQPEPQHSQPQQTQPQQSLPPQPELPQEKPAVRESTADLDNVLAYFSTLRNVSANDFRREQDAARQAFGQTPSELNRVRLALVMSFAANPQKDERRALELLEPMTKVARPEQTPLRAFAIVIQSFVREQVKLGSNAQALKDKLDQLMSLEKSLAERERAAPGVGR